MSTTHPFERAKELEREIIHLEVGELDLSTPTEVRGVTPRAHSHYADSYGITQFGSNTINVRFSCTQAIRIIDKTFTRAFITHLCYSDSIISLSVLPY